MRKLKRLVLFLLLAGLLGGGALAWALLTPAGNFTQPVFFEVGRGMSGSRIAQGLTDAGIIASPWHLWLARALAPSAKLQAGQYRFETPTSVWRVFDKIRRGEIYFFEFTVPEGSNVFDIADALEAQGIMKAGAFLEAAAEPAPIQDIAPQARTLEGYLFPSTYRLNASTTAPVLIQQMTSEFRRQWHRLNPSAAIKAHNIVTLASLVEKETGVAGERRKIASVFANRLEKGMLLQCDPTTIYAALLDNRYRGVLHRSDLDRASPYNTYQSPGLPPGPIANPGAAALEAALHPDQTDYLFFVATPEGGSHHFSATSAEHERAVALYRHAEQAKKGSK